MNPGPLARIEYPSSAGLAPFTGGYSLHDLLSLGEILVPTGFLPPTIKTPQQVAAIVLKGSELRLPPMYALSNIVVVQGRPTCSAELMLALIYRDHGDLAVVVEESTPEVCRVSYRRRAWDRARAFAFTLEDARRADLAGKGTWKQYPQAMLRARAVSAVARLAFPDSIAGMYTPEELGLPVQVTDDGAVEVAGVPPPPSLPAEPPRGASGGGALPDDAPDPGPDRPRMDAVVAVMDAAMAVDTARGVLDEAIAQSAAHPEERVARDEAPTPIRGRAPRTRPAPRWGMTPKGREVSALVDALEHAGVAVGDLPADDADDAALTAWVLAARRRLRAREAAR